MLQHFPVTFTFSLNFLAVVNSSSSPGSPLATLQLVFVWPLRCKNIENASRFDTICLMAPDFKQVLEEKKQLVWPEIKSYLDSFLSFPSFCQVPAKYISLANFHRSIVSEYPERKGKYLRPALVLLTAKAMGYSQKKAIKTAAAMQISEDWILNHDDIEDDSLQRRGKPALHQMIGKELAINAADGLHILMWKVLRDNLELVGTAKGKEILDEFCQMLTRTILGQTVEIKWTQENRTDLADKDVLFILESKTGYYTIAGPMRLGAILAGANKEQLNKLYQFGKLLGYCFQIRDDLLDLTSDFAGLKKQTGNDIYEGKRTIMLTHLLRVIKGKDKKRLSKIMKKKREEKTKSEVKWVIEMMEKYGSLNHGRKLAEQLSSQAKTYFDKKLGFLSCQPARDQLRSGINFILERNH